VPTLPEDVIYMPITHTPVVVTLRLSKSGLEGFIVHALAMSGEEVAMLEIKPDTPGASAFTQLRTMIATGLERPTCSLRFVTPHGQIIGQELTELLPVNS